MTDACQLMTPAMKFRHALAACLLVPALLAGCGGSDGSGAGPAPVPQPEPQPDPKPSPVPGHARAWGEAAPVDPLAAGGAAARRVVMNAGGEGFAIWTSAGFARVSRYTPAAGWGAAESLQDTSLHVTVLEADIAIDAAGNAVAVWIAPDPDNISFSVWAARFQPATGWSTGQLIETSNDFGARAPSVLLGEDGNAYAAWVMGDANGELVWFSRMRPSGAWTVGEAALGLPVLLCSRPALALRAGGGATLAWGSASTRSQTLLLREYTPEEGWVDGFVRVASAVHEGDWERGAMQVSLGRDTVGNLMAAWKQVAADGTFELWARRRSANGEWNGASRISAAGDVVLGHSLATDPAGNAMLAWTRTTGTDPLPAVWASRYTAITGWQAAVRVSTETGGPALDAVVVLDGVGRAALVWSQGEGPVGDIWAARWFDGWHDIRRLENSDAYASSPSVAADAQGNALAVWDQQVAPGQFRVVGNVLK